LAKGFDKNEYKKASENVKKVAKQTQFMSSEDKKKLRSALLRLWNSSQ
jgi:hypothetical protein